MSEQKEVITVDLCKFPSQKITGLAVTLPDGRRIAVESTGKQKTNYEYYITVADNGFEMSHAEFVALTTMGMRMLADSGFFNQKSTEDGGQDDECGA